MWNKVVIDDFSWDVREISMERQIDINQLIRELFKLLSELSN